MNEQEARAAITIEHTPGYTNGGGSRVPAYWDVRTPNGWCWEKDRHLNTCFSKKQAMEESKSEPIQPCEPNCMVCGTESEMEEVQACLE